MKMDCFYNKTFSICITFSLAIMFVSSFTVSYGDSGAINLDSISEIVIGNDVLIAGSISDEIRLHPNLPVSIEVINDRTGNVVFAKSTVPDRNDRKFSFVVSGGKFEKFDTNEAFTIIAYYGLPNPSLLNTKFSASDSFKLVQRLDEVDQTIESNRDYNYVNQYQQGQLSYPPKEGGKTLSEKSTKDAAEQMDSYLLPLAVIAAALSGIVVFKKLSSWRDWNKAQMIADKINQNHVAITRKEQEHYIQ